MNRLTRDDFRIRTIGTGYGWAEGPAILPSGDIVFSDVDSSTMWICRAGENESRVFRQPSSHSNGNTVDHEGRLITCHHATRSVNRTERDGTITVLADRYAGRPLNSPNDVVVARDGAIWFTDPPYGILRKECGADARQEQDAAGVFRLDPRTGELTRKYAGLDKPNGLAFSPDERSLYVSDTGMSERPDGPHHIYRFDVTSGTFGDPVVFKEINPGVCDGFRVDADGNVWSSAGDGIHCYAPDGEEIGRILLDDLTTNICLFSAGAPRGFVTTAPSRVLVCELVTEPQSPGFCRPASSVSG
jgi:gluconolactonase